MKFAQILVLLACPLLFSAICLAQSLLEPFRGEKGEISIVGGTAPIQLMKGAARRISTFNPNIRINVAGGGTGSGILKVAEGSAQIGNAGRPLSQEEIEKFGLVSFPYAIDGVAVAVNQRNPVADLTPEELKAIFAGKITNWREVGGMDAPIAVYTRERGSGARHTFEEKALAGAESAHGDVAASNAAMKAAIARDIYGIGYLAIGNLDDSIKGLKIGGQAPTQEAAAKGDYKFARYLYMNTKGQPQGIVKSFIDYVFSPEGAELIRMAGYLPYKPEGN